MMPIPDCAFKLSLVSNNNPFLDFTFTDKARRSDLRAWRVTFCAWSGEWVGFLLRSCDAEDNFDFSVEMPDKILAQLVDLVFAAPPTS